MERSKSAPLGIVSVALIVPVPEGTVNECFVLSLPLLTVPVKVVVPRGSPLSSATALRVAVADCVEACISGIVDMAKLKISKTVSINFVLFIFSHLFNCANLKAFKGPSIGDKRFRASTI